MLVLAPACDTPATPDRSVVEEFEFRSGSAALQLVESCYGDPADPQGGLVCNLGGDPGYAAGVHLDESRGHGMRFGYQPAGVTSVMTDRLEFTLQSSERFPLDFIIFVRIAGQERWERVAYEVDQPEADSNVYTFDFPARTIDFVHVHVLRLRGSGLLTDPIQAGPFHASLGSASAEFTGLGETSHGALAVSKAFVYEGTTKPERPAHVHPQRFAYAPAVIADPLEPTRDYVFTTWTNDLYDHYKDQIGFFVVEGNVEAQAVAPVGGGDPVTVFAREEFETRTEQESQEYWNFSDPSAVEGGDFGEGPQGGTLDGAMVYTAVPQDTDTRMQGSTADAHACGDTGSDHVLTHDGGLRNCAYDNQIGLLLYEVGNPDNRRVYDRIPGLVFEPQTDAHGTVRRAYGNGQPSVLLVTDAHDQSLGRERLLVIHSQGTDVGDVPEGDPQQLRAQYVYVTRGQAEEQAPQITSDPPVRLHQHGLFSPYFPADDFWGRVRPVTVNNADVALDDDGNLLMVAQASDEIGNGAVHISERLMVARISLADVLAGKGRWEQLALLGKQYDTAATEDSPPELAVPGALIETGWAENHNPALVRTASGALANREGIELYVTSGSGVDQTECTMHANQLVEPVPPQLHCFEWDFALHKVRLKNP